MADGTVPPAVPARVRRSEGFAVRRWLQLGAAGAGMGAVLWGMSLTGPQAGTALADTGSTSSASSSASRSEGAKSVRSVRTTRGVRSAGAPRVTRPTAGRDVKDDEAEDPTTEQPDDSDQKRSASSSETEPTGAQSNSESNSSPSEAAPATDTEATTSTSAGSGSSTPAPTPPRSAAQTPTPAAAPTPAPAAALISTAAPTPAPTAAPTPTPAPSSTASWQSPYQRWVARSLAAWSHDSLGWIAALQTSDRTKEQLEASFLAIRRTFFNQAPIIDPVQITGVLDGPVTGTLGAYDPDGDRMIYVLTRGPRSGSVQINADGSFTYTPGDDFDGVDGFRVTAIDIGFHTNLLEPLRPIGSTPVRTLINQGAVTFDFDYIDGAEHWTAERRAELQRSAEALILYFRVLKPVVLTYAVKGENKPDSDTLASAGSDLLSESPGFWNTVVQHKLLTGKDGNGAAVDGEIDWNFGFSWGLGNTVAAGDYDFRSTAMHELLHSFGFLSMVGEPGDNDNRYWLTTDRFLVNANGRRLIGRDYRWDDEADGYLTGQDGGLFFGGRNAVAAYGGLVPLFAPDPWSEGSSANHTDDVTFAGDHQLMMNARTDTGPGIRVLSAIEIGFLRDLGYRIVDVTR